LPRLAPPCNPKVSVNATRPASPIRFEVRGQRTSGLVYIPHLPHLPHAPNGAPVAAGGPTPATLVLAHGAGAPQTHPWMVAMARAIAAKGLRVVTFNFLYTEDERRTPDRKDVLEATWRAAIDAVRALGPAALRLFIGGKSMGGRIATQVAAEPGVQVDGLVLLGYPLHPPGKPEQLRTAHLGSVRAPMLFVQGSRDAFGTTQEMTPLVDGLAQGSVRGTRLFVIEGADHSLATPKTGGVTLEQTMARVADEVARFTS
jgi:predicted alpha/beta-hydrolase family hydrolase